MPRSNSASTTSRRTALLADARTVGKDCCGRETFRLAFASVYAPALRTPTPWPRFTRTAGDATSAVPMPTPTWTATWDSTVAPSGRSVSRTLASGAGRYFCSCRGRRPGGHLAVLKTCPPDPAAATRCRCAWEESTWCHDRWLHRTTSLYLGPLRPGEPRRRGSTWAPWSPRRSRRPPLSPLPPRSN